MNTAELTPWETRNGLTYKREDLFAPFGAGGVNGAKLRQLMHLMDQRRHASRIFTGCSVLSPQGPMVAVVARELGIPCTIIHGGTDMKRSLKHANVTIAAAAGADFEFIKVGYNPALQAHVARRVAETPGAMALPYGITTPGGASDREIERFHRVGARQARNLPAHVRSLIIPMGSANSTTSILYGLSLTDQPAIERITLVAIGPDRREWARERLRAIERITGAPAESRYHWPGEPGGDIEIEYHDLHGTGWATYSDRHQATRDGITFHPTYEGKVVNYLEQRRHPDWTRRDGTAGFWIVGAEPKLNAMSGYLRGGRR